MATGKVRWFSKGRGYGFICDDESGRDIFVHHSGLIQDQGGFSYLEENERVSYLIEETEKGLNAKSVVVSIAGN